MTVPNDWLQVAFLARPFGIGAFWSLFEWGHNFEVNHGGL